MFINKRILALAGLIVLIVTTTLAASAMPSFQEPASVDAQVSAAFTYQGTLEEGGSPANGSYDFQFILYNALSGGAQVGSTVNANDVAASDGGFSVALNFGSVFDGVAVWLEIAVRPGARDH